MAHASDFGVGVAHELAISSAKAGLTPGDWEVLSRDPVLLGDIRAAVRREADLRPVIDDSSLPKVPCDNWTLAQHTSTGRPFPLDVNQLVLFRCREQTERQMQASEARHELSQQYPDQLLNARFLEYFCLNSHRVPVRWRFDLPQRPQRIIFWGSLFKESHSGSLVVRAMRWCVVQAHPPSTPGFWAVDSVFLNEVLHDNDWSIRLAA